MDCGSSSARYLTSLPLGDGSFLKVGGSHTKREVAKFSARDADRLDDYQTRLTAIADVLRASVLETPPNVVESNPFVSSAIMRAPTRRARPMFSCTIASAR